MATDRLAWLKPTLPSRSELQKNTFRRGMKYFLPLLAFGLLGTSIYWAVEGQGTLNVQNLDHNLSGMENTLEEARFTSMDSQGRPFIVEADRVIQQNPNDMTAQLENPKGNLELNHNDALTLTANQGDYNHDAQSLELSGNVILQKNDEITFTTQALSVDINAQKASNNVAVTAITKEGHTLDASAVDMSTDAQQIFFKGPASLTINTQEKGGQIQ